MPTLVARVVQVSISALERIAEASLMVEHQCDHEGSGPQGSERKRATQSTKPLFWIAKLGNHIERCVNNEGHKGEHAGVFAGDRRAAERARGQVGALIGIA